MEDVSRFAGNATRRRTALTVATRSLPFVKKRCAAQKSLHVVLGEENVYRSPGCVMASRTAPMNQMKRMSQVTAAVKVSAKTTMVDARNAVWIPLVDIIVIAFLATSSWTTTSVKILMSVNFQVYAHRTASMRKVRSNVSVLMGT